MEIAILHVDGIVPREAQHPSYFGGDGIVHKESHALLKGKARSLTASAA